MKKLFNKIVRKVNTTAANVKCMIESRKAEGYVDSGGASVRA